MGREAREIQNVGTELFERIKKFVEHYNKVGERLAQATDAYNRSLGSYDKRLRPQGAKFAKLVAGKESDFPQAPSRQVARRSGRTRDIFNQD